MGPYNSLHRHENQIHSTQMLHALYVLYQKETVRYDTVVQAMCTGVALVFGEVVTMYYPVPCYRDKDLEYGHRRHH